MTKHKDTPVPQDGSTRTNAKGLRTDIQGMRAIAVGVVLLYHVLPDSLTGGFVGVDVFFVISGFLITTHLVLRPPQRAADFAQFWARRARRLLPASLLVLVTALVATRLLAPETLWDDTARQARGAALYFVNWMLAGDAVDYLAADNAPTAVQHFWSLSVEEQFYLFWPLLIALLAWLSTKFGWRREIAWTAGLSVVAVASLAWSVHLTATDPGRAYFVTTTRVWELAVGGLVALALVLRPVREVVSNREEAVRAAAAWAGIVAIAYACVTFDASTPFPSWRAGIPVLGAAAVILASAGTQIWSPGRFLALRPMQWLGDISYAVYLWHWPLVIIVGALSAPIGLLDAAGIVGLSLVLAHLTTRYVEAPFRDRSWNVRVGLTYRLAAAGMAVVVGLGVLQSMELEHRSGLEDERMATAMKAATSCIETGMDKAGPECLDDAELIMSPARAEKDSVAVFGLQDANDKCVAERPDFAMTSCVVGDQDGNVEVALIGNSHAAHLVPALEQLAHEHDWRVDVRAALACSSTYTEQSFSEKPGAPSPTETENCQAWVENVVDDVIESRPDLVIMSNRLAHPALGSTKAESVAPFVGGYRQVLERFADAEVPVAVVRDVPIPLEGGTGSVPGCVASSDDGHAACAGDRDQWLFPLKDPAVIATKQMGVENVRVLDLTDSFCTDDTCHGVIGGLIAYHDGSHLTATFSRALAGPLEEALRDEGLMPRR